MRHFKIYISMMLAVSMMLPVPAKAAIYKTVTEGQASVTEDANQEKEYAQGEALILYREQSTSARSSIEANGLSPDIQIEETYEFENTDLTTSAKAQSGSLTVDSQALKVSLVKSDKYSTEELLKQLNARKDVLAAEPNYKIHALDVGTDTYAKYQWALDNRGQNHGTEGLDVNPEQEILEAGDAENERVIALVDTGMDYTHDDLKNAVWNNPVKSNKLRGIHGYDFINYDTDPMDDNGHGSHCSGIMAAESDNGGIRGVVKNPNVKIMALKILDEEGSGYGMEAVGAYNYIYKAQQLGIDVVAVNNSWGGVSDEESVIFKTLIDLVGKKGAVSVCAAGNDGMDNDVTMDFPASIDSKYIISVAASNENDELASFSNYGMKTVDLAAPGTDILSTVSYDCFNPGIYENKDEYCSVYEDFSDGNLNPDGILDGDNIACGFVKDGGNAEQSVNLSDEAYFGLQGDEEKSLKWNLSGAKEDTIGIFAMPVQSACIEVVAPDMKDGYIEGGNLTGIRHYMPGDVICIAAEAEEGYFIKQFTVNGKNVARNSDGKYVYRTVANEAGAKVTPSVKIGAYVLSLIMEEELELYAGQSYQLEPFVIPENAENQKIIWSSSNPKIVSVNQNGMASVSAKAKKGNMAVITAKAADRGEVKATCRITVSTMPLPEKNEIVSSGKLMYKVTKSSAKKKTVICMGFADKAVKSVKIPDTIKTNGYTFKVTGISKDAFANSKKIESVTIGKNVTSIGKNAFLNCTSLKSIQIRGISVKKIGKNAWKGINKKAVISVPQKRKKLI